MRGLLRFVLLPAFAVWVVFTSHQVWSFPSQSAKTGAACAACHANPAGGAELTEVGKAHADKPGTVLPKDAAKAEYVGAAQCRICHPKQHKSWATTRHAQAWDVLAKATPAAAAAMAKKVGVKLEHPPIETEGCVSCHVTGMGLPGGYPAADSAKHAALINVTCESCHGPGSLHVTARAEAKKNTINRGASAKNCTQCHTPAIDPKFDYATAKTTGTHAAIKLR